MVVKYGDSRPHIQHRTSPRAKERRPGIVQDGDSVKRSAWKTSRASGERLSVRYRPLGGFPMVCRVVSGDMSNSRNGK